MVRFYSGTTVLGTDSTSPYEYTWNDVAAGFYFLTAHAEDDHGAVGTSGVIGVSVSSPVYYTLALNVNPATGGGITVDPAPTGGGYLAGTPVSLTATPNAGYEFAGWSGDITGSSTTNPMTVAMDGDRNITANFRAVQSPQQHPVLQPGEVRISGGPGGYVDANVNPNVVIRFRRAAAGKVTVRIYDLRGRLVAEKNKDGSDESDDEITWNAADMPAGVYIIQISGGGIADKKKTAILK